MRRPFALALFLGFVGCPGPDRPADFALRIAAPGDLSPFHPRTTSSFTTAAMELVYQPVLRVGGNGAILPGCVRHWQRLARERVRLELDPGLQFSDGSPVGPGDVVRSLAASGLEAREVGAAVEVGRGTSPNPVEVALLYTVVFKEASPAPLGTGPFRLVESDPGHVLLERVHPEPGRVARVEIKAAATSRDAFAKALRGDANAVVGLDERQSELMEGVPSLQLVRGVAPHAVAVVMNAVRFSRAERRALATSMPVVDLAQAYGGSCAPLDEVPSGRSLPAGRALQVFTTAHDPGLPRVALALRRAIASRGGEVAVEEVSRSRRRVASHDFDLFVMTVVAWPTVMLGGFTHTGAGSNFAGYSNPRVDEAFDRGDVEAALAELEKDPPFVLVCRRQRIGAVDARIKNPSLGTWGLLETLPDWEVGP